MSNYCTPAEVRTQIEKTGTTGSGSDAAMNVIIEAVSRLIDRYYNRPDNYFLAVSVATARYYPGTGRRFQWIDDCVGVSAVAVKDSPTDDENDYVAWTVGTVGTTLVADVFPASGDPRRPDYNIKPYTFLVCGANGNYSYFTALEGYNTVKVTALWGGYVTIPPLIKEATIALTARAFKQGQSAWADASASSELAILQYVRIPPDVKLMLDAGRYTRPAIGRS